MRKAKTLSSTDEIVHAEQTTGACSEHIKTCKGKSSQKKSNDEIVHSEQTTNAEASKTYRGVCENSSRRKKTLSDFEKFKAHKTEKHNLRDDKTSKKLPFKVSTLQKVLGESISSKDNSSSTGKIETGSQSTGNQVDKKEKHEHNPEKEEKKSGKDKHKPPVSLRERMMDQLKSARFRFINEQLYTQTGSEAVQLFKGDTEAFNCYHEGFQNQVNKWPTNPVDLIIKQIKAGSVSTLFSCKY
ncbi:RRP8 [Mytilus edulis]|uniref:Ribosomal RNA-processing protein 8 n=1 Tax=Mytilus edulis TaxID=6550 RepID=A0A8S3QGJ7_MYTED|nr:RRP8 [Mytilus edulis]